MKYSKEGQKVFVPCEYHEITIENIKKGCKKFFHKHCPFDFWASEMHLSCTRVHQIPHFKILYIQFIDFKAPLDDLSSICSKYVNKYSQSDYNRGLSNVP